MAKTVLTACAFALALFGFGETNPEDWFSPPGGFWRGSIGEAKIYWSEWGRPYEAVAQVDESGYSPQIEAQIDRLQKLIEEKKDDPSARFEVEAMEDQIFAFQSLYEALQAQVMVFNMADNLNRLFNGGEAFITNTDGTESVGTFKFTRSGQ